MLEKLNDRLAVVGAKAFGTMWACYGFAGFGLVPLFDPGHQATYMYWSNVIQLVALPMLMVGTARVGGRTHPWTEDAADCEGTCRMGAVLFRLASVTWTPPSVCSPSRRRGETPPTVSSGVRAPTSCSARPVFPERGGVFVGTHEASKPPTLVASPQPGCAANNIGSAARVDHRVGFDD